MRKNSIAPFINHSGLNLLLITLVGIAFWIVAFVFNLKGDWDIEQSTFLFSKVEMLIPANSLLSRSLGFLFTLLLALMLLQFNARYQLIRKRTALLFTFPILLIGSNVNVHEFSFAQISVLFLLMALWQLFNIYQKKHPVKQAFNIGLFLSIGSFFMIELLFFLPIFIIGMMRFGNFNIKTLLAILIGFFCFPLIYLGVIYLQTNPSYFLDLIAGQFYFELGIPSHDLPSILYLGTLFLCGIIAIIYQVNHAFSDKIRVSRMLGFVAMLFGFCIFLFFCSDNSATIFTFTCVFSSILYAHLYSLNKDLFVQILFWTQICACLLYFLSFTLPS